MSSEQPDSSPWIEYPIGAYTEEQYAGLSDAYRAEVEFLSSASADRANRRLEGETIPMDEIDQAGARENGLLFPRGIARQVAFISTQIAEEARGVLLGLHPDMLYLLRQRLRDMKRYDISENEAVLMEIYEKMIDGVRLHVQTAVEELVVNGLKHGNTGDVRKTVVVRRRVETDSKRMDVQVADEGNGFVREELPDPLVMLGSMHGRGLLLADQFMSPVELTDGGRVATVHTYLRAQMRILIGKYVPPEPEKEGEVVLAEPVASM